ncbi:MAG: multidrug effflux MFS transporter [Cypionkella sp.]|nr:multidrug effflux MFS transporter [Cypionkella sp.]
MRAPKPLRRAEFVALMAALYAIVALSIDAMLPALPEIAATLSPAAPNRAQLVVTSFVLGLGIGTFVVGPISDAYGRKMVILGGSALFIFGAFLSYLAGTLEWLLAARFLQGLGAAAPRVAGSAMIRDLFKGRAMAEVMSVIMATFMVVPALAPLLGQAIIALADWRAIFLVFAAVSLATSFWLGLRQPETLPMPQRQALSLRHIIAASREVTRQPTVRAAILLQGLIMGGLFAALSSMQGIFDQSFDRAANFPKWFALIAVGSALGSVINARYVQRVGMRKMALWSLSATLTASAAVLLAQFLPMPPTLLFAAFLIWAMVAFGGTGMTMGNLNALALEPLGHIAGLASSIITALSTVMSVIIAIPVGLAFAGTPVPLLTAFVGFGLAAQLVLRRMPAR